MVLDDKSCCGKTEHSFLWFLYLPVIPKKKRKKKSKVDQACKSQSTVQPSQMTYDKSKRSP
jgi:hypothetical protein